MAEPQDQGATAPKKKKARPWWRRLLRGLGVLVLVLIVGLVVTGFVMHEPLPSATPGPEADARARAIHQSVDPDAWAATKAVAWTFRGQNRHLWDRDRGFVRVQWDDTEVQLRTGDQSGWAKVGGERVLGEDGDALVAQAYGHFINDSFWLMPLGGFFDEGVTRGSVALDGQDALMITYASGGVTPGDSYVWFVDEDGRPTKWKMWVGILPVGGIDVTWEGWQQLSSGVWVSTSHTIEGLLSLDLGDVRGATTLAALEPEDPFEL